MGIPFKLSETPGEVRTLDTPNGTHTDEILTELGYKKEEIERLRDLAAVERKTRG